MYTAVRCFNYYCYGNCYMGSVSISMIFLETIRVQISDDVVHNDMPVNPSIEVQTQQDGIVESDNDHKDVDIYVDSGGDISYPKQEQLSDEDNLDSGDDSGVIEIQPGDKVTYVGVGAPSDQHFETQRSYGPSLEASQLGSADPVQMERQIDCGCSRERKLTCPCTNIYVEVVPYTCVDTKQKFMTLLKQYAKDDPMRKTKDSVHVHLTSEHAIDKPLREWGTNPEQRLLAMAFPKLFPFGLTSFILTFKNHSNGQHTLMVYITII